MEKIILVFAITLIFQNSDAQLSQASRDSLNKLTQIDHQHLMKQLGIEKIRQCANESDPKAANAANFDKAKANPFPNLPELIMTQKNNQISLIKPKKNFL